MRPGILILLIFLTTALLSAQPRVMRIDIHGSINPASAKYVHDAIADADAEGYHAVMLRLNTPGGLLQSTRDIVADFLGSPLPVIVYVAPGGGQAASAGAFITMAGHVAAMAPGTNIGAAHPVSGQGQDIEGDMGRKVVEDTRAFAEAIAK
ncbi:MAG: ATP-dependent Clp protease proteolytic subunit, partial [Bacteroidota bacterium]|nr:ATP-dependent Clp protease proteolytic subunit [Bacteroidota bacterium]